VTEPTGATAGRLETIRAFGEDGFSRAAESLGRMLGCRLCITVTGVCGPLSSALPAMADDVERRPVAVLQVRIDGDGRGWALILLPRSALYRVLQGLLGTSGEPYDLAEIDLSAVQEFGNVLVSSFLSELGDRFGRRFLPSPPALHLDDVRTPIRDVLAWARALDSEVGVVHARMEAPARRIEGEVFVVLDVGVLPMAYGVCT
jgi:chemotaxis protein CheY-P-specific phosphatase CheC